MTGFGVSASYGLPDTGISINQSLFQYLYCLIINNLTLGLLTATEMANSASIICNSLKAIPCIGDGDTVMYFIIKL